nr:MAG TPA: hypothetical protein [Caudoviricetes sp.]DAO65876.1 MAG TPA: hypothetical protein [Caudoviricetes sp.]DAR70151.1 MAG TPA: hypothetical protein [Caudoviricetes sp.]DAX43744.1 MAG TPA: hypothetical protein [Caudoviricetes sp.]
MPALTSKAALVSRDRGILSDTGVDANANLS